MSAERKQNEGVVIEYGEENLKNILSNYLIERFIEELNKEEK